MQRMHSRLIGVAVAALLVCVSPALAQVTLGSSSAFAVLGGQTVTNTGPTVITGEVGVSPGSSVTGFPPGNVIGGTIHLADGVAGTAQTDLTTAYNAAAGQACNTDLTGQDLGGLTLTPGVYCYSSAAQLTGVLTLDFQGNPAAFFDFKIGSTITTASGASVLLINTGGVTCPTNVFWQVGSSATFGTGSSFIGNVLALTSITLTTAATLNGRALARNGSVTLDTNTINTSFCAALVVCPTITVNPATLPAGSLGVAYNATISATGGTPPYTFTVTSGALPPTLVLNPTTGVISGTPANTGTFNFTITASDANACLGTRAYSLVIGVAPGSGGAAGGPTLDAFGLAILLMLLAVAGVFAANRFMS